MENRDIIEGLKLTKDLYEFDPATGDKVEPHMMNDLDRTTYDAVCGALERLTSKKVGGSAPEYKDAGDGAFTIAGGYFCPHCKGSLPMTYVFCPNCGQALDWRTK